MLKTNSDNFLFIPLNTINRILYSGFREISSEQDINKQFADLDAEHQFKDNGFIIPAGYSRKIFIYYREGELDCMNRIKDIDWILN